jgi:HlyD family secretion protein
VLEAESLQVEAKVAPQEIDQLRIRQPAAAFSQLTTPEIKGNVLSYLKI